MPKEILNIENAKSFATRANLDKALAKLPEAWRFMVVNNAAGRFTAIFTVTSLDGDLCGPAQMGFPVIG